MCFPDQVILKLFASSLWTIKNKVFKKNDMIKNNNRIIWLRIIKHVPMSCFRFWGPWMNELCSEHINYFPLLMNLNNNMN
jgi:hypothetical protein